MKNGCWFVYMGRGGKEVGEKGKHFGESLETVLRGFEGAEKLCVLGDMNAKVGDREVRDVVGRFSLEERNENGDCLIELCRERRLKIRNTWFRKRDINKITWVSEVNGSGALIDYMCVG